MKWNTHHQNVVLPHVIASYQQVTGLPVPGFHGIRLPSCKTWQFNLKGLTEKHKPNWLVGLFRNVFFFFALLSFLPVLSGFIYSQVLETELNKDSLNFYIIF